MRPRLVVDLDALAANRRRLLDELGGVPAGAAVKADAYGLGAVPVARRLYAEGCREFFVAGVDEAIGLRAALPEARINVFNGIEPGTEDALIEHRLVPLAISLGQLDRWRRRAAADDTERPVGLHFDTGMHRTGIPLDDARRLAADPARLRGLDVVHVLSHLARADEADPEPSARQRERFVELRAMFPWGTASLANSGGVFLGPDYHFDLARPGIALYGGAPRPGVEMDAVATIEAPVLQVTELAPGAAVGYGGTHVVARPSRHAVVGVGYADGYLRAGSGGAVAAIGGVDVPVVGRISMDLTVLDVTDLPPDAVEEGTMVELLGPNRPVDDVARRAGTIANEVLTSLGRRYERLYRESSSPD